VRYDKLLFHERYFSTIFGPFSFVKRKKSELVKSPCCLVKSVISPDKSKNSELLEIVF
jgi:hypothetical protein